MGIWDWVVPWAGCGRGQWGGDNPWHAIATRSLSVSPVTVGAEIRVEGAFTLCVLMALERLRSNGKGKNYTVGCFLLTASEGLKEENAGSGWPTMNSRQAMEARRSPK